MAKQTEKMMPHSIEAEQSVLGCVLIDTDACINIMSDIKDSDFYVEAHKIIFSCMYNVYRNNSPVDFVTLTDALEKTNMLESVGGIEYITTLTNIVPSAASYKHYSDIVKRNSILRKLILASNNITNFCYEGADIKDALTFAEKCIYEISQKEDKSSLTHLKESVPEVLEKFETIQKDKNSLRGLPTGIYGLDKITNGLHRSDLIFIAGRPGSGKTSLAMNIVNNAAIKSGAKVAVFSLEMPRVQLAQRSLCSVAYVDMAKALKGELTVNEWKALWGANEKLSKSNIYVDDSSLNTPVDILSKCRRLKAEHGLDLIMIDYLQLMNAGGNSKDSNRQQEISYISRNLKIIAKELDVPVIVLSQLSRAVEQRTDHRPQLSDLRESGSIEQDADIVLFVYREDMYATDPNAPKNDIAKIIVAKHRNGALGDVAVKWVGSITTFVNLEKDANAQSLEGYEPPAPINDAPTGPDENMPEIVPLDDSDITDIF